MIVHSFSIELARKYGVEKAIVIHNLAFWQKTNEANGKHIIDGHCWTFNSARAFSDIFSYFSQSKMKRILRELEEKDKIITSGIYNKLPFDRTKWYSIIDNNALSIYGLSDGPDLDNGRSNYEPAIPDINTNITIIEDSPEEEEVSNIRKEDDIQPRPPNFTTEVISILEEKAERKFSADPRWLSRFRNDLGSLLNELNNDHERILKALTWYQTNPDCFISIDSGFSLKDKFSKLERLMLNKRDDSDDRREKVCEKPGIVKAEIKKPWNCSKCNTLNSGIDKICACCVSTRGDK